MCVHEHIGIVFLPLDEVCKVCPQAAVLNAVHQVVVVVEFHQTATACKGTTQFVQYRLVVAWVRCWRTELGEDETVSHQCVDRTDGRVGYVVLIYETVAIGDPVLASVGVVACLTVIVLLTPCSICDLVPEW